MIRFILKSVFWLSLAFIVMPKIINQDSSSTQRADAELALPPKEKIDDIVKAGQTAAEIGGFCYNNPGLCAQGKNMLSTAGSGLLSGSGQLLDFLSGQFETEMSGTISTPEKSIEAAPDTEPSPANSVPLPRQRPQ